MKKPTAKQLAAENQMLRDWIDAIRQPIIEAAEQAGICATIGLGDGAICVYSGKSKGGDVVLGFERLESDQAVGSIVTEPHSERQPVLRVIVKSKESALVLQETVNNLVAMFDADRQPQPNPT